MEAILLQCAVDSGHPLHLPVSPCEFRVVLAVDMDAVGSFVFGRVAGSIGHTQYTGDTATICGNRYQPDAHPEAEILVFPNKLETLNRFHLHPPVGAKVHSDSVGFPGQPPEQ